MILIPAVILLWVLLAVAPDDDLSQVYAEAVQQASPPVIPARIFGRVYINGKYVPANTKVTARIDNKVYATTYTTVTHGISIYVIDVPADAPNTSSLVKSVPDGKTIVFWVNKVRATEKIEWHSGKLIELNLNATLTTPVTPAETPSEPVIVSSAAFPNDYVYKVQPGDSLSKLAGRFSVTLYALAQTNGLRTTSYLYVGQRLHIPPTLRSRSCEHHYYVKKGDTMAQIAAYFGVDYHRLAEANGIKNPNQIYVKQSICIPYVYAGNR